MEGLLILIVAVGLGCIPATIASRKGGSWVFWWLYGSVLFILALPHALLMKPDRTHVERQQLQDGMRKCPHCAELVKGDASVCRYCQRELPEPTQPAPTTPAPPRGKFKSREEYEQWKTGRR